jgi:NAD(P)-dependent dehydrogenase (short-subunit alcohol dehydrogenase family)
MSTAKLRHDRAAPPVVAGRRVLLTGATSGIGLALARRLSAEGARLALLARTREGLDRVAAELPGETHLVPADVTDHAALRGAVAEAAQRLGGLDAAVAVAGIAAFGPFAEMAPDDWRQVIDTTLVGMMDTAQAALPALETSGGVLVLVGSISGRLPTPWLAAYAAAKHGIRGFARTLSAELRASGSRARVVLIAPGPVDTPIWRRSRTTDRREPPPVAAVYRPGAVVDEVLRAIARPQRTERTVGGLMALAATADALLPELSVRVLGAVSGVAWRRRAKRPPAPADTQSTPVREPGVSGGFLSRPSALAWVRGLRRP